MSIREYQVPRFGVAQVPSITPYYPQDLGSIFGLMFLMLFLLLPMIIFIPVIKALVKSFA